MSRAGATTGTGGSHVRVRAPPRPDAALVLAHNLAASVGPEDVAAYDELPEPLRRAIASAHVRVSARAARPCLDLGHDAGHLARLIAAFRIRSEPDGSAALVLET